MSEKCKYFTGTMKHNCSINYVCTGANGHCSNIKNCYYKQLQALKQERDELKADKHQLEQAYNCNGNCYMHKHNNRLKADNVRLVEVLKYLIKVNTCGCIGDGYYDRGTCEECFVNKENNILAKVSDKFRCNYYVTQIAEQALKDE